jgi:hypothetical protein
MVEFIEGFTITVVCIIFATMTLIGFYKNSKE